VIIRAETAEALGLTPGAVRVAQHRALNRLRDLVIEKPSAGPEMEEAAANGTEHMVYGCEQMDDRWDR
jgi:hypothetical protein